MTLTSFIVPTYAQMLKALSGWVSGLDGRGITLVPITAVPKRS